MNQDILAKIGYELDIPTLAAYCRSGKNINRATCDNSDFWRGRLRQDFHITSKIEKPKTMYYKIYDYMQTLANYIYDDVPLYIKQKLDKSNFTNDIINTITVEVVQRFNDGMITKDKVPEYLIDSLSIYTKTVESFIDEMDYIDYQDFDDILAEAVSKIVWSTDLFESLKDTQLYLDVNKGVIVHQLEIIPEINDIIVPSLHVVGTRENIINHFMSLGVIISEVKKHLNNAIRLKNLNIASPPDSPR